MDHITDKFLVFYRCSNRDVPEAKLVELYLLTNDPVYGSLMELDESSTESAQWFEGDPTAEDLKGLWIYSLNSWNCRDTQESSYLVQKLQEAAYESVDASTNTEEPDEDWGKTELDQ